MKRWAATWKQKFKEYWQRIYHYTGVKLTRGAQEISRVLSFAHKDNWRKPRK